MAESDWTVAADSLDINTVDRGATSGITPPPGGGAFVHAFNSLSNIEGSVALYANQANFSPMAKGGSIRGAIQRGPGGGTTLFAPFLFLCLGGTSVNDSCYKLGLSDEDPHRVVLRKGSIAAGLAGAQTPAGLLLYSTSQYIQGDWVHLRLDAIVNENDDVILAVFMSDLDTDDVDAPTWVAVPGMEAGFVDDHLGIASGSQPFTSGRGGMAFQTADVTRRGYFDHIEVIRQV